MSNFASFQRKYVKSNQKVGNFTSFSVFSSFIVTERIGQIKRNSAPPKGLIRQQENRVWI
ncbi:hypothetical protein A2376_00925 [Candidatus Woesebacteria bacterium RIFOXYB1_FULL_47_31]|uniref:Uncharacterized protein n=1 Tax=Candidatus Woesebacteria bacterium RIFOXYB1_FULL_47_31 TaxID=1802542 RepID=A0A1F8D7I9_9BACT|nr:MAG: hypothetical protein A2376_00925 [Candidatus Woesebacteria bacterium RIFOXYB1_FULL_47_31]